MNNQDTDSSVKVAVINEELASKYLGGSDPLQQRLLVEQLIPGVTKLGPPVEWQIVGVYHNVRDFGLRQNFPEMLVPFWQSPWPSMGIGVRTAENPASIASSTQKGTSSPMRWFLLLTRAKAYNPIARNCEHTATEALRGVAKSPQLLFFAAFAVIIALLVICWSRR